MSRSIKGYGYSPDLADWRDRKFASAAAPQHDVDLRSKLPAAWDQGDLGSCVWHGIPALIVFNHPEFMPSRLWGYYKTRAEEHDVKVDGGCQLRDAIKVLAKLGSPPESEWPYVVSKFAKAPPAKSTRDAKTNLITSYERVEGLDAMLACLDAGYPFAFGATMYESFESDQVAKTGMVPMPSKSEAVAGGHCQAVVGKKMAEKLFIVRGSYGTDWGDNGYCYMPFDYLANSDLTSDCWMIRS